MDIEKRDSTKNNLKNRCEFCYFDPNFNQLSCSIQRHIFPEKRVQISAECFLNNNPSGSKNDCDAFNDYMKRNLRFREAFPFYMSKQSEQSDSYSITLKKGG